MYKTNTLYEAKMKTLTKEQKFMHNLFWTYNYKYTPEQLDIIYEFLHKKSIYSISNEYSFACWLKDIMHYQLKVTTPSIPMIINIELNNFKRKFTFTPQRKELFKILQDFISRFTALEKIDYHILIGGSFTDILTSDPKDIDLIFIIPNFEYFNYVGIFNERALYSDSKNRSVFNKLDIKFLPNNYSFNHFKAYSHLTSIGNNAKFRKGDSYTTNSFKKRLVVKLNML